MRRIVLLALLMGIGSSLGCDSDAPDDAAIFVDVGPGTDAGEPAPEAPAAAAPVAWECPDAWSEVTVGTAQACEPWPNDWTGCPTGERRFVGDTECAPFGLDCPAGDWPDGLPASGVLYVREGASSGDGTSALPFGTIGDAILVAADGDVIAIARGVYDEAYTLGRPLTLWGACASETFIRPDTTPDSASTIETIVAGVVVRDLTIGGDRWGLRAHGEGTMDVSNVIVSGAMTFGLVASGGGTLRATDTVVRGVRSPGDGSATVANAASTLALTRVILEDNEHAAVFAFDEGTRIELTDVAVRRSLPHPVRRSLGVGFAIGQGAHLVALRVVVEDTHVQGIGIQDRSSMDAADLVIRRVRAEESSGQAGGGLVFINRATGSAERVLIEDTVAGGASVLMAASAVLRDIVVTRVVAPEVPPIESVALLGAAAATLELERAHAEDCEAGGVAVVDWSTLTGRDITIRNLRSSADMIGSRGVSVVLSATAELDRLDIAGAVEAGVYVGGDMSSATVRDLRVADMRSRPLDGRTGRSLVVAETGSLDLSRTVLTRSRGVGAFVRGASLVIRDAVIEDTLPMACEEDTCTGMGGGTGLAIIDEGSVHVTRFVIRRSFLAGIQIARTLEPIALSEGLVAENPIGVNVQAVGFDLALLSESVIYRDNGVNLDSSELYLPEPDL